MQRNGARPRLRTRLIAWYAGLLCCALLVAAVAVRFAVVRALERAHNESVASSMMLFRQFFRTELAEFRTVDATLTHIAAELVLEDRAIDVHRPDGSLFVAPGQRASHPYPQLRPPVRDVSAPLDPELAPGWRIDVHASAATLASTVRRIDLWLLGGVPLVVLVSAMIGWWMAGRALRPIGLMAAQARTLHERGGARLTLQDPTDELGRFGASFNAVLDHLDEVLAQQRRFLADAAHELRTPIARLRSRAELGRLELDRSPDGEVRERADAALLALERELRATSEVVGGLLALARADSGATAISLRHGFLDDTIADELPRWRESASAAGITIELGDFEEVQARFDDTLVRRLLGLLIDNSLHYSPEGSVVTLHLTSDSDEVQLNIEDQGIGIPAAEREVVFRRFHRTAVARSHRADGSGLGLALARWIVERHGGSIEARDRSDNTQGVAMVARWPCFPDETIPISSHELQATREAAVRL